MRTYICISTSDRNESNNLRVTLADVIDQFHHGKLQSPLSMISARVLQLHKSYPIPKTGLLQK